MRIAKTHSSLCLLPAVALMGCAPQPEDVVRVAFIGSGNDLTVGGVRLSPAEQHLRAATTEGLVALNAQGEVVPALAERWIVTDDGLSYIFRLRNADWPDGTRINGDNVRAALMRQIAQLENTSLGLDLSIIDEIRAMTGRVVEIRLKSPMPQFLQLLAQPELGLQRGQGGSGPMVAEVDGNRAHLRALPPAVRGLPMGSDWAEAMRQVRISDMSALEATQAFDANEVDAVLNGHLLSLPLTDRSPLSRGTVRLDVVFGLFGLQVTNDRGLLADPARRETLAMAIERETLLEPLGIGSWAPSVRIVPQGLAEGSTLERQRWPNLTIEQRRVQARARIASWNGGEEADLSIALPDRVGTDLFFFALARDFDEIGITLRRAAPDERADLMLVDRIARYGDPRWFLNQFSCGLSRGGRGALCASEADDLVAETLTIADQAGQARLLAEAEETMLAANIYIPIGAPIRWSLVRGGFDGFAENPWGLHPLFPMAVRPT